MKKQLSFINKQHGFFLPYVLFITAIVLFVLTVNTNTYKNDIRIIHNHLEQLKIETLVQMGREKFKVETGTHTDERGTVSYSFPPGNVKIIYNRLTLTEYRLFFTVETGEKTYTNINTLLLNEPIEKVYKE
ncbi:hypothetical protein [Virgibacillus dakarensis]|uniref:hypothetical protein n=1 Tax=Virgibacillus dakarensis TaxID=1917889 RepID=UPI000B45452F|nr:hypothetical protein [Virgibacillus dakarensis]